MGTMPNVRQSFFAYQLKYVSRVVSMNINYSFQKQCVPESNTYFPAKAAEGVICQ